MAASLSWTRHSSTSSPWLLGWVIFLSLVDHSIFRASIQVLGQFYQLHSMSLLCLREVIQLMFLTILLSLHCMFSFLDRFLYQHHFVSIIIHVSCRLCGIHQGPPATGHFLLTSAHYPGSWLRNILWYLSTCIHQWKLSSLFETGLHQWNSTKIIFVVFEINSFIRTIWIVL